MSSRNVRLDGDDRLRAASLQRALRAIQEAADGGQIDAAAARAQALAELDRAGITPEYLELVAADTLAPVPTIEAGALAVVAARVGGTRLIDNLLIQPTGSAENGRT
jgi:pantoate--beta-alanine ligase